MKLPDYDCTFEAVNATVQVRQNLRTVSFVLHDTISSLRTVI